MQDVELYRHILGIEAPWTVREVKLRLAEQRVEVYVEHPRGQAFACPECGASCRVYDHSKERSWRHLDSCQFQTFLIARPPRVECEEHGIKQVRLPWAEPDSRFTLLFERLAIDVLRQTTVEGASKLLSISWDQAHRLMARAVARGQVRKQDKPLRYLGVDEKSVRKGHDYLTLVCDIESGTIEYIGDDRKASSLDGFYQSLGEAKCQSLEAVAMDMWAPYVQSTRAHLPEADTKIVFDRFHLMTYLSKAVDKVRRQENRTFVKWGLDLLKKTKHLWLYGRENLPERHQERFAELRRTSLKTGRAWAIKEELRSLWSLPSKEVAKTFYKRWINWARRSRLAPIIEAAQTVHRHRQGLLTYFDHPITNAVAEGLNGAIQAIKQSARGFRNRAHFKTAIFFHCGGLDLYPQHRPTHALPG